MRHAFRAAAAATLALTAACASMAAEPAAPQPAKPVDESRLYSGAWHEIARNPMKITDGCVAGLTEFKRNEKGALIERDSCRMGTPDGKEKVIAGPVEIDPAGQGAKFTAHYKLFGPFGPSRTYWVLDRDDAYGWFIEATPDLKNLSIFTRDPQVPTAERDRLVARAKALGYDTTKLEFPALPTR